MTAALFLSMLVNGAIFAVGPFLLDRRVLPLFSPHALLNLMMPIRPERPDPEEEQPDTLEELPKLEIIPLEMDTEPPPPPEITPPELKMPEMEPPPQTPPSPLPDQKTSDMPDLEIALKPLKTASVPIAANVHPTVAEKSETTRGAPTDVENRVYGIGEVDSAPRALGQALPPYPRVARRRGIEGWVKVRFLITKDGKVRNLSVIEESPAGVFHKTVLRTVPEWRFRPARKQGEPVDVWVEQTINFKLDQ
ncbi:TonB-dependent receptor [delta proteobacterium NaphS2]|nr:TonB-dependent receptor [delta proteobacterium NaphS2]